MQITELHLKTHCLADLRDFYERQFGFEITSTPDRFTIHAGDTLLTFEEDVTQEFFYHFAFNIPNNLFDEAKQWLQERTPLLTFNGKDEIDWTGWDAKACYYLDPGGNIGELIARYKLDNTSHIPFCAASILRVSEIGMAVEAVDETVAYLQTQADLALWDGGGEIFAAVGDAEGLLIIVKKERSWFPTNDRPAGIFPFQMTIRGKEGKIVNHPTLPYQIYIQQR